ncbi:cytochrome P450 [Bombardia bombarda]|uniref:Cytochrome P450 n=1 Tax=Bombardia bombarda TaxID=252184 RepID=A0AA39TR65_9PEZI|nr:cytochrome P450 [Bombardia bombarda]
MATTLYVAATYIALFFIPLCFLVASYRLLFHPLHRYPGPFFAKVTEGYGGWFAIRKRLHLETYRNFQKYGPVVRQAPNRLVFNTATALHDIYLNPRVTKGKAYRASQMRAKYPSMINAIDSNQHRRKKKYISPVMGDRSMRIFEPTMSSQIDIFLRLLLESSRNSSYVDMTQRCQRLGVDIVTLLAFGYRINTQTDETSRFLPALIDNFSWRISTYMQFPALKPLEHLLILSTLGRAVKFANMVKSMIKTRMAQDKDAHHDLYSVVAGHLGKRQVGLYNGELWPEAILFIMAGGTTTATAMSALFFYLARNPTAYARLTAEIRSTFASGRPDTICSGSQLHSCKYLRACIDEAMRMSPPVITPIEEPFIIDGHVIPRGTQVAVSLYSLFHNEEYFPDSFAFKPEHWLEEAGGEGDDSSSTSRESMRKVFAPFILGDRSCAGRLMAYQEASLTVARTLWYFDFELAPGKAGEVGGGTPGRADGRHRAGEFQLEDIMVTGHTGPNLVFRLRGEFWKELELKG